MAIVTPLLLLLLFGIIQYGMLFHSMQAAAATARDAATQAATGIQDCAAFGDGVRKDADGNGVPANPDPWALQLDYDPTATAAAPYGTVTVDLEYTPQNFVRLVPMPGPLHQGAVAPLEDPSAVMVTTCQVTP
jgi:Flp pilus assembly protein TadG